MNWAIVIFLGVIFIMIAIVIMSMNGSVELDSRKERIRKRGSQRQDDREYLAKLISNHHVSLFDNWKRTVYVDEYDTVQLDDWEYEIEIFFKSVDFVPKVLTIEASKERVTKAMELSARQNGMEEFTRPAKNKSEIK